MILIDTLALTTTRKILPHMRDRVAQENQRLLRRRRRIRRNERLQEDALHLQTIALHLARKYPLRRSLRIQSRLDNAGTVRARGTPWYSLILFGEDGYWDNGGPTEDGYNVVIHLDRLPIVTD